MTVVTREAVSHNRFTVRGKQVIGGLTFDINLAELLTPEQSADLTDRARDRPVKMWVQLHTKSPSFAMRRKQKGAALVYAVKHVAFGFGPHSQHPSQLENALSRSDDQSSIETRTNL